MDTNKTIFIKKTIIALLIINSTGAFVQKNRIHFKIKFSTIAFAANYERVITDHFSLGAKLGRITYGTEANYY